MFLKLGLNYFLPDKMDGGKRTRLTMWWVWDNRLLWVGKIGVLLATKLKSAGLENLHELDTKLKWKGHMSHGPVAGTGLQLLRAETCKQMWSQIEVAWDYVQERQIVATLVPTSKYQIVYQASALTVSSPMNAGKCSGCANTVAFKGRRWSNEESQYGVRHVWNQLNNQHPT